MSSAIRSTLWLLAVWNIASPSVAQQPAGETKPKLAAPLAKLAPRDGDSIVFLGDSITHQCLYTQYVEDYFYTRFPKLRLKFHNSGVGGDRCSDALIRFDRDVADYKPNYVVVLLGMNDGGVQPYNDELFQTYRRDLQLLLDKIEAIDAVPILATPTMFDARAARAGTRSRPAEAVALYNATLAYYGAWLRETAVERGCGFVEMYGPLNNLTLASRKTDPAFTMIRDAVHPDAPGQLVMAYSLIYDLQLPRSVSTITIARNSETAIVRAVGAKVSDVEYTADGLRFVALGESLPMAVPPGTEVAAKLLNFGHRLGREAVQVHDLESGEYELTIDGQSVGRYTAGELARGVELQGNEQSPQYRQSSEVLALNKRRNEETVHPLRDLWREKKLLRITAAAAQANPGEEATKKRLEELEASLATMEDKIEALETKAREFEAQIFTANQPQSHEYRLVRLK